MDGSAVQIIDIKKDERTGTSTYDLKSDVLRKILFEVKDEEVAVISIAGPTRQGKSFLLSYLLRYLSNPNDSNWIGKDDKPLEGFKWNHGINPETRGIWIWSKPIIVKKSFGKDKAIIIMDTQGVYDDCTDLRDWSTIVGITLLTSSCFIFNVFTDIQENVLTQLETFLNYGLIAMDKDEANKHAFQRLIFLIRDWNHSRDFNYGHAGGKEYIHEKLLIKSSQPKQSQRTRQIIRKCFEEVTCYLMPEPGAGKDKHGFDGSPSKLQPKFTSKLKELFTVLLNADSLKPKVINGNTITGRDLFDFFEVLVEKFNGDELPQPMDIVEFVAKATDLTLIHNLIKKYVGEMNKELNTKPFQTRKEIDSLDKSIRSNIIEEFRTSKKSETHLIVRQITEKLESELKTAHEKIHSDNDAKREKVADDTIAKCIKIYNENMNKLGESHVKTNFFDNLSKESKNLAKQHFFDVFGVEDKESYANYLLKIKESIEDGENSFKSENRRRKSELRRINKQAIEDSLTKYREQFESMLNEKVFFPPEMFSQREREIRSQTLKYFRNQSKGDEDLVDKYLNTLKMKLNDEKLEFKACIQDKMKGINTNTEEVKKSALNYCKQKIKETLNLFGGSEDLNKINADIKQDTIQMFERNCSVKDTSFLSPYVTQLENEINKVFDEFLEQFENKTKSLDNFYKTTIDEAMQRCFVEMKPQFKGESLFKDEESRSSFREKLIIDVQNKYKNVQILGKLDQVKEFVNEQTGLGADSLLIDRLIKCYKEIMTEKLSTKTFFSREKLSQAHSDNSEKLIKTFKAHKKTTNYQLFENFLIKLEDNLKVSFQQYEEQNEQKREKCVKKAIDNCFHSYEENMARIPTDVCIESNKCNELMEEIKNKALKQLNDVCGEEKEMIDIYVSKLLQLIETSENKFISENNIKISEANKRIAEAVDSSVEYYSKRMGSALNENLFHSRESFKQYENEVREEANNRFTESCKNYEETNFRKKFKASESEITDKIKDALSEYDKLMDQFMDTIKNEQQFISKHEEVKMNVIIIFKQKCSPNDDQYINLQVSKLETLIKDKCNQFHERLSNQIKRSEEFYEKFVNNSYMSYTELMNGVFQNSISISEKELQNSHQNVVNDILSEFEKNFQSEEDSAFFESKKRELDDKITNEYQRIVIMNESRNEKIKNLDMEMRLKTTDYAKEYEERIEKKMSSCNKESELLKHHLKIMNIIRDKMIASNPFSNNDLLEPYLTKLEEEINKSFKDVNIIFKVTLENQSMSLNNMKKEARKYYKEEMGKYYADTSHYEIEDLRQFHNSVTDHTIDKFNTEKGNMSIEEFKNYIIDSLKDIYKSFVEENDKNAPNAPSIGIDLGTTNSCVAFYDPLKSKGTTVIVLNTFGNKTTPSVVAFGDNNEEVVGEAAKDQSYTNCRNTIYSAKRLIGRQFNDEIVKNDMRLWPFKVVDDGNNIAKISVKVDGKDKLFFPEEISAKILKNLKEMAEKRLGCKVKNAVITVPAYFNDAQKESTKDAGKIAGLNVLKIINEPTAAALAFQINRSDELGCRKVLIFDFGGGTLDVVVLAIEGGVIDIKAVGGDNHLGGDDIDAKIVDFCLNDFSTKKQKQIDKNSEEGETALRRLTTECEKWKKALCSTNSAIISVDHFYDGEDLKCELTREKFEELNNDLFIKSVDLVAQVLQDANLTPIDIDDVVLVGGTTRIPKIQELLTNLFDGKSLNHSVNPDEAVAIGAAIQAAILNGNLARGGDLLRVSDVTPMSLGLKVKDGFMSVIIHRNSKVPNKYTKLYETTADNQTEIDIEIYEGEDKMAENNRKLGSFKVSNIPRGVARDQQIEVTFDINDEGILHVNAKIMSNSEEEEIHISEHKGRLTDEELQKLIDSGSS